MATTTTNLGLSKPEYTDAADIAVINSNMDTLDSNSHTLAESIGKVVNGNKTAETNGIAIDEYVSLENSTIAGRADGIYKASKAIPYNTAIDSTYLSPISGGLGGEVSSLNSKINNLFSRSRKVKGVTLSPTDWTNTTLSATIPGNKIYGIRAFEMYNETYPGMVALSTASTGVNHETIYSNENDHSVNVTGVTSSTSITYYFFAKSDSQAGHNDCILEYWYA